MKNGWLIRKAIKLILPDIMNFLQNKVIGRAFNLTPHHIVNDFLMQKGLQHLMPYLLPQAQYSHGLLVRLEIKVLWDKVFS